MRKHKPQQSLSAQVAEFIAFRGDTYMLPFLTGQDKVKFSLGKASSLCSVRQLAVTCLLLQHI
jgi:hypothetical protein